MNEWMKRILKLHNHCGPHKDFSKWWIIFLKNLCIKKKYYSTWAKKPWQGMGTWGGSGGHFQIYKTEKKEPTFLKTQTLRGDLKLQTHAHTHIF